MPYILRAFHSTTLKLLPLRQGPGLSSSLLIGNTAAKSFALTNQKPFIAVNHMEGHLCSPFLETQIQPHISMIVSGGHTLLIKVQKFNDYQIMRVLLMMLLERLLTRLEKCLVYLIPEAQKWNNWH